MSVFGRIGRFLTLRDVADRAVFLEPAPRTRHVFESAPRPIDDMFREMYQTTGRVSREQALSVPAVLKARDILCSFASLPLVQLNEQNETVRSPFLGEIDPMITNVVTLSQTIEDLVFEGVSYWRITQFGFDGFPRYAEHLDVRRVTLLPINGDAQSPLPAGYDPRGTNIYIDGIRANWLEVIRFDSPNPARLKAVGRAIRTAIAFDRTAAMYASNPRAFDYLSPTDDQELYQGEELQNKLDEWEHGRQSRATGYLPVGLQLNQVENASPADLQLVELRKYSTLEIANAMSLDPEDLGISTTSRTYNNATDRRRDRINNAYGPYLKAITERLSKGDVTPTGHRVEFDLDDYLKSNPTERWTVYQIAVGMGAMTVDEVRAEEGLPPLPAEVQMEPIPSPVPDQQTSVDASRVRTTMTFGTSQHTFVSVPVMQFSVNTEARTIEGLALPYGKIGHNDQGRFRFAPGALQVTDTSRNKLLRYHDRNQAVGRLVHVEDREDGVFVRYKVGRGPEGDQALFMAADGVTDGFSVGVDFTDQDVLPDPHNPGVALIRRADWYETSLVAMPAFDDARVTRVAASRTGGSNMPCTHCGQVHAEGVACTAQTPTTQPAPVAFSQDQVTAAFTAFMEERTREMTAGHRAEVAPNTGRTTLDFSQPRAGYTPSHVQVNEAMPYRFDRKGNLQAGPQYDFSTDLISGMRDNDVESYGRALKFMQAQFVTATTDINELNPTLQRPDMYVDQLDYLYPISTAISKGAPPNGVQPFDFPKFSSASGLVGDHSEGNEPSAGTFVTTKDTVSPSALSGKAVINREVWDMGGNPAVSNLIWNQMVRGYREGLESYAAAQLDAASPTVIALCGASALVTGTGKLPQNIAGNLALLQFARGGFLFDDMFLNQTLYLALAELVDTTGRPLFPVINPMNASGTAAAKYRALDLSGQPAYPAWALGTSSYLLDRTKVSLWWTAPQRLDFQYQVKDVTLAIWGYKAFIINDINGVRELTYTGC